MTKMKEPKVLKLIRQRARLRHLLDALRDGDAPSFSKAFERHEILAAPLRRKIADLDRKIGTRPKFWRPRPKTKEDWRIERQYAEKPA